jgi:hypothetical protein
MPSQVTVTAKTGPAVQATSLVLANVTSMVVDMDRKVLQVYQGSLLSGPAKEFDLNGVTTLTDTISGANHTIVVS